MPGFNDYIGTVAADDLEAVKGQQACMNSPTLIVISTPSWQSICASTAR